MPGLEAPFMVVAFTEQQEPRGPFDTAWPQHMTVVPWMEGDRAAVTDGITAAVADYGPVRVEIMNETQFGRHRDISVWTLGPCGILSALHKVVLYAAEDVGAEVIDDMYTGKGYRPHISRKAGQPERSVGDTLVLPTLSVIGKGEDGHKTIYTNIPLGAS